MKPMSSSAARKSVAGLAVAVCTLAAIPAAMAQSVQAPYYDPVRDVIVTPSSSAVITTTDDGS